MKILQLSQGKVALLDDADYLAASKHAWHAHYSRGKWYARRSFREKGAQDRKVTKQYLHHFLVGKTTDIDHVDGDGLNNQRANLRHATKPQNQWNSRLRKDNTSGFKGVQRARYEYKTAGVVSWDVIVDAKRIGRYRDLHAAAVAYDCAAIAAFGDRARTNLDPMRYFTGNDLVLALEAGRL